VKAKLIKTIDNGWPVYSLRREDNRMIATTQWPFDEPSLMIAKHNGIDLQKLSHTNCDEIFGVVNVENLAKKYLDSRYDNEDIAHPELYEEYNSFIVGFNKRAELNKDKVFSEEQMFRMFLFGHSLSEAIKRGVIEDKPVGEIFDDRIKFIQQPKEIDVEIVMSPCYYDTSLGGFSTSYTEGKPIEEPKLDKDGCLILKRVI
jgi:hypothetical protein